MQDSEIQETPPAAASDVAAPPPEETATPLARRARNELLEWAQAILFAVVLALVIRTFIVQAFKIPSASMEPTLLVGDHIMVSKFIYGTRVPYTDFSFWHFEEPARGDIVIFLMPEDVRRKREAEERTAQAKASGNLGEYEIYRAQAKEIEVRDFVKRVIGLPGETVAVHGKQILINGQPIVDPWGHYNEEFSALRSDYGPVQVPPGHYFCMGDNRDNSQDSRVWGFVPAENIKGKAFVIYWSWDEPFGLRWNRIMSVVE